MGGRSASPSPSSSRRCSRRPGTSGSTGRRSPRRGGFILVAQPRLPRRPAHRRAHRLRPRPAAALPREVGAVQEQGARLLPRRRRPDPGRAAEPQRRRRVRRRRRARCSAGECVVVYPEGTITRDPGLWPMTGKSGAARIALATGCPVIPVGQWGAQELLAPYAKKPDLFPRKLVTDEGRGPRRPRRPARAAAASPEVTQQATDRIMAAITALVEDIRGERRRPSASTCARPASGDRQPEQDPSKHPARRSAHEPRTDEARQGRRVHRRVVGDGLLDGARRRRQRGGALGAARGGRARRSTSSTRTPTTSPGSSCRRPSRPLTTSRRPCTAPTWWCWPRRRSRCAQGPHRVGAAHRAGRRDRLADEGCRARHPRSG